MLESLNPQEGANRPAAGNDANRPANGAPLADREVPLPGTEALGATPAAIHAWLDGEGSEADAQLADSRQVALWNRIADDAAVRRRMTTPSYMQARIMDALPEARPAVAAAARTAVATDARIALTPTMAVLAGLSLVAAGFLLAKLVG
jgi:hypothetical protein